MRTAIFASLLFCALPAFAADAPPASPPSPSPVTYEVWGYQWDGRQYVKQPTRCLTTTDLKQASDYATQIDSFAGWTAATNLPDACVVHTIFNGAPVAGVQLPANPTPQTFSVWAFTQQDGKWVKDDKYSWTTTDPEQGLAYAKKVDAVSGWQTTTNCPAVLPPEQRYVNGGPLQGANLAAMQGTAPGGIDFGPIHIRNNADGGQTVSLPYMSVRIPAGMVASNHWTFSQNGGGDDDISPSYDNSSSVQDMINTQDMLNQQQMNNNMQEDLDTQNFLNTENMINTQNAFNAMNP